MDRSASHSSSASGSQTRGGRLGSNDQKHQNSFKLKMDNVQFSSVVEDVEMEQQMSSVRGNKKRDEM